MVYIKLTNINLTRKYSNMKKILLVLAIVFTILTFVGAGYVLMNKGTVSAGYAVIPMVIGLVCSNAYRTIKRIEAANKENE